MIPDDRAPFAQLMYAVYSFYQKECSEIVLDIWWSSMRQYDLAVVREALNRHVMNPDSGQFLPKPADVVKMLGGSTQDSALQAWTKLETALQRVGTYMTVAFDDPLIHRVVNDMGGWVELGKVTTKDWEFRRNEFVARYRGFKMRGEVPAYPPVLIGIVDGENRSRGYPVVPDQNLRLIGDETAARRVLIGGSDVPRIGVTAAAASLPKSLTHKEA